MVFLAPTLTPGFTALQLSAGRYSAYGVLALLLMLPRWRRVTGRLTRNDWIALAWLGLAGNIVYYIFLSFAVRLAGTAPASFIVGLLPVVITIIGSREQGAVRLGALLPSLALAVIGVGLIAASAIQGHAGADWRLQAIGLACAFGSLASWALFAVGNARTMARLPHLSSNDWSLLLGIVSGAEALLLALPAFAFSVSRLMHCIIVAWTVNGAMRNFRAPWNWQMPVSRLNKFVASSPKSAWHVKSDRSV